MPDATEPLTISAGLLASLLTDVKPVVYGRSHALNIEATLVWLTLADEVLSAKVAGSLTYSDYAQIDASRSVPGAKAQWPMFGLRHKSVHTFASVMPPDEVLTIRFDGKDGERHVTLMGDRESVVLDVADMGSAPRMMGDDAFRFALPTWDSASTIEWPLPPMRDVAGFVRPAASTDDARPILTTMALVPVKDGRQDGIDVVATDSYRLAVRRMPGVEWPFGEVVPNILIPATAARYLSTRETTYTFGMKGGRSYPDWVSWVDEAERTWHVRLVEGEFPNYRGLLPASCPHRMTLSRDVARGLVNRGRKVGYSVLGQTADPMRLVVSRGTLEAVFGGWRGSMDITDYESTEQEVGLNPDYFLDGLETIPSPVVTVDWTDRNKPWVFQGEGYLYLLMPVRI